jgi:hypothetical protein
MTRIAPALVVALGLALPFAAFAGDARTPKKVATPLAVSAPLDEAKLTPRHRMPARYAKDRRHFSRDVDPRTRLFISVPILP